MNMDELQMEKGCEGTLGLEWNSNTIFFSFITTAILQNV